MIIGLSGYARSGKDSVADILTDEAGFIRVAFADKLREALYALNPIIVVEYKGVVMTEYLQVIIDGLGWEGVKSSPWASEVRRLLQRMGTEAGRQTLGDNIWVDATFNDVRQGKDYVFTDCRFPNEAAAIQQDVGGKVWRISRQGVGPANDHISEIGLDDWWFDNYIHNDGSLTDLREMVLHALETSRRF